MSDVFVVPASEGDKPENRFSFKIGRKTYTVPFIQYLSGPGSEYIDSVAVNPVPETTMVRRVLLIECPAAEDEIKSLANDQIMSLFKGWTETSSATVGESSASEGS